MWKILTINAGEYAHALTLCGIRYTTGYSLYTIKWSCEDPYHPMDTNSNENQND